MTISKDNINELEGMFQFAALNNIFILRIGDIVQVGKGAKIADKILDKKDYEALIPFFFQLSDKYKVNAFLSLHMSTYEKCIAKFKCKFQDRALIRKCDLEKNKLTFNFDGSVTTCCNLIANESFSIGNIDKESIGSILKKQSLIDAKRNKKKHCPVGIKYHINFKSQYN